ncbi:MAG: DUF1566 domain-containing protein [Leptospiraceae bacterium]|nr:DUF1566 domain-containing protein [Leptospiraceae bacterium]
MKKYIFLILLPILLAGISCDSKKDNDNEKLAAAYILANSSTSSSYDLVDTNQTKCYTTSSGAEETCSGKGYDADYTRNAPSYEKSSDGTVITDKVTGLMWTQSTDINGDGSINYSDKKSQSDGETYCSSLTLGGYSDWRLPDIKTLYSLIEFSGLDASAATGCSTAGDTSCDTSALTLFLDTNYFDKAFGDISGNNERAIDAQYLTTSTYVSKVFGSSTCFFGVNFVDGRIKCYPNSSNNKFYVRCVRGTTYGVNKFTDNGDKTITDSATGLMWQQEDSASTDWDNAISTCESLSLAGYTDWRLPNTKEQQSIVDYTRSPSTTSSAAIDSRFTTTSLTNEGGESDFYWYWNSTTHADNTGDGKSAAYNAFGRAVGYYNSAVQDVHGAGAQRSNYKTSVSSTSGASTYTTGGTTYYYKGPQGDFLRQTNRVRCVRTK